MAFVLSAILASLLSLASGFGAHHANDSTPPPPAPSWNGVGPIG